MASSVSKALNTSVAMLWRCKHEYVLRCMLPVSVERDGAVKSVGSLSRSTMITQAKGTFASVTVVERVGLSLKRQRY